MRTLSAAYCEHSRVEISRDCSLLSHGIKALVKAMKGDWRADPEKVVERPKRQKQHRLSSDQIQELADAYRAGEAVKEGQVQTRGVRRPLHQS